MLRGNAEMDNIRYFKFTVPGPPQGKGRPRFLRATGRAYTPKETASYENLIKVCAMEALNAYKGEWQLSGYYDFMICVYFPIPKSRPKEWKELALSGEIRAATKPDIDNIVKVFGDALNGIAWKDDQMISNVISGKYYAENPRCEVCIVDITSPLDRWARKR